MKRFASLIIAGAAGIAFAAPAHAAAPLNIPLPANAYITFNGLQWAWAIPLPGSRFPNALSYQGTQGWRLPTTAELLNAPNATDFLFPGGNAPFNGTGADGATFAFTNAAYAAAQSAGACASAYFNSGYSHCDWGEGNGQPFQPWAGSPGARDSAEQLYVRLAVQGGVPEPATWAMLMLGFGAVGWSLRRRQRVTVRYA